MRAGRIYWLLPLEWLAHFADEWAFGFPAWSTRRFEPLPESLWVAGMAVLTALVLLLGRVASRPSAGAAPRLGCAGVQMVFFSNGLFHLGATLAFGEYSPGTASGLLLYLPLSPLLWRAVAREPGVTRSALAIALAGGFGVHALVLLSLSVDKSGWTLG